MPKRIVDGEALWSSSKVAGLPPWAKAEIANLIPLSTANGTFEFDARKIWQKVYSFNRPEMTVDQVQQLLSVLRNSQIIHTFRPPQVGKRRSQVARFAYFVGIHKPGRLPSPSRIERKHEACACKLPARMEAQWLANGRIGSGSGSGSGSGENQHPPVVLPEGGQEISAPAPANGTSSSRQGSGLTEYQLDVYGEKVIIRKPENRRLWTEREKQSLNTARADRHVEFFRAKGFEAWIAPKHEAATA